MKKVLIFFCFLFFVFCFSLVAETRREPHEYDPTLKFDPIIQPNPPRKPLLKENEPPSPPPEVCLPKPAEEQLETIDEEVFQTDVRVLIKHIQITGNTIFSTAELRDVAAPYLNQKLGYLELEKIRRELTQFYINHGYINSGAILPDQTVSNGTVSYRIIEGELTDIEITGNRWLRESYYKKRIRLSADPPVNIYKVENRLQLLQEKDMTRRLYAALKPGLKPGQSILDVRVEETSPFTAHATFNNYQSPSIGAERGILSLSYKSVTGLGDRFDLIYGRSEGLNPLLDLSYDIPFTPRDTSFRVRYRMNEFDIVQEEFQGLDIESGSKAIELVLTQPFLRIGNHSCTVGVIGERLNSKSWSRRERTDYYTGSEDGESTVSAIRFFQTYLYRSKKQAFSAHSRFSWGIDAFDATIHKNSDPDSRFFAWLGQVQWAGVFTPFHIQPVFRIDAQLADQDLLSLEQLPVGGRYSVRGYRENQMVRDNGIITSLEVHIPLIRNRKWSDSLSLIPFFDFGRSWNKTFHTPKPREISSIGIGLNWSLSVVKAPYPVLAEVEIFFGHQLKDVDKAGDSLQDDGFHFQTAVFAF